MNDAQYIHHLAYLAPYLDKEGACKVPMQRASSFGGKVEQTLKKAKNH